MESSNSTSFPSIWTLPVTRKTLQVDRLKIEQHQEAFQLIDDAAKRGDNVGLDEIASTSFLEFLLTFADVSLTLCDLTTKKIECLIIVTPCRYVRSQHPSTCSFFFVTSKDYANKTFWREFAQVAQRVTLSVAPWYSGCTVDVFVACTSWMLALREEGFIITTWVPDAGKLARFPGYCSSYIMYKDFGIPDVPKRISNGEGYSSAVELNSVQMGHIQALPFNCVLPNGMEITVRQLRHDEIPLFYNTLKSAVDSNIGYGLDELPDLAYFVRWYITDFYNMVYEVTSSKEIIAFANFGSSLFSRGADSRLGDGNLIIVPKFRGQKISHDLLGINTSLSLDEGMIGIFGETAITNLPSLRGFIEMRAIITGTIPKGIYFKDKGWVDLVTHYIPNSAIMSFRENRLKLSAKL